MADSQAETISELRAALGRAESRCRAVLEVGCSLTTVHDLDELLALVVDLVTKLTDADRSTIFLIDRDRGELWSKLAQGVKTLEIRLPLGKGFAGWVAKTGKTVNLKDAYQDKRFNVAVDQATGYRTRSVVCTPMRNKQGEVLGVIQTLNKRGGHFTPEDERLLEAISSQVAIALENAQLIRSVLANNAALMEAQEKLKRTVKELDILYQLEKVLAGAWGLDEMLENLLKKAVDLFACEAGSIQLISEEAGEIVFLSAVGSQKDEVKRLRIPLGAGVAGWAAAHGQPAIVNDPQNDERHLKEIERRLDYPVRNLLAIPMMLGGRAIGALELLNKRRGQFNSKDEKLATVVAGQAASAIQLGRHREEAEKAGRMAAIGRMLSGLIHDFRTPMTIISGYVQMMAREIDAAKRRARTGVILSQFEFMNTMIKELLSFARGESDLLVQKVYTKRFLEETAELLSRELEISGVKLKIEDRYAGAFRADANKLRRLVFNLTRNAREAMPKGGVFSISVADDGDAVRFEFADTGPGIPEDIRGRLFQSFVTSGKEGGTGLGLAMAKSIVGEHGGRITAENLAAGGARFRVWLPKRLEATAA